MKLKYNVLCIDDDLESLRGIKRQFSELNEAIGITVEYREINARAAARENERDDYVGRMEAQINEAFSNSTFDLMWIDLHLDKEVEGHELIKFIRDHHSIYRPVIFYSAGNPVAQERAIEQLNDAAKSSGILGRNILITPRTAMGRMLADIATEMHSEEQKVNQVRGMLMDQVSELDANIIKALSNPKLWSGIAAGSEEKLLKFINDELVEGRFDSATRTYKKLKGANLQQAIEMITTDHRVLDIYSKTRLLKEILSISDGMERHSEILRGFLKDGGLNMIRNNYAHKTADALGNGHTPEMCVAIRNDTRLQLKNICDVLDAYT